MTLCALEYFYSKYDPKLAYFRSKSKKYFCLVFLYNVGLKNDILKENFFNKIVLFKPTC